MVNSHAGRAGATWLALGEPRKGGLLLVRGHRNGWPFAPDFRDGLESA